MVENKNFLAYLDTLSVTPGTRVSFKQFTTDFDGKMFSKAEAERLLSESTEELAKLQDKLYAHNQYSMLIVLQAMDAAGKDGAIKHVMSGLNPQGVNVTSFKTPNEEELEHDYLWRHSKALPARGEIGIFNRSHYENVLVTRVHPEYILNEKLPYIETVDDITDKFWKTRFKQINRFEKNLKENGTIILKFFLHISKAEQKKRFLDRIDDPTKNWKFSMQDISEREHWESYMNAYEEMISSTSKENAIWYILPADDKWFTRLCLSSIIYREFSKMKLEYPEANKQHKSDLLIARKKLMAEK